MPSKSGAQHRFMGLCSTEKGRAKAKGKCPPVEVAKEYVHADKGAAFLARHNAKKGPKGSR